MYQDFSRFFFITKEEPIYFLRMEQARDDLNIFHCQKSAILGLEVGADRNLLTSAFQRK